VAKKKSHGKANSGKGQQRSRDQQEPVLPDRRAIEGMMQGLFRGAEEARTPLEQAQQLMYSAFELEGDERTALAREALEISPDCADAYIVLAESVETVDQALELYQQGVAAGERALGKKAFKEYRGHFWGFLETRPYMRARLGLAQARWDAGLREEALDDYRDLLRLNPNDNQGVRYILTRSLLELDRDNEVERLLEEYAEEGSADWAYARALLAFRKEGESSRARQLMLKAQKENPHIPDYLTGRKPTPVELPDYVSLGGEDEAIAYVADYRGVWRATPGALAWMRKVLKLPLGPDQEARRPAWRQVKARLSQLSQAENETWQVDARQSSITYEAEGGEFRPWILLVTNRTADTVLEFEVGESRPSPSDAWDYLINAMMDPRQDEPHRPMCVEVRLKTFLKAWQTKLQRVEIECVLCDELEHIDQILERMPLRPGMHADSVTGEPGELAALPQEPGEIWQADVRHLPTWLDQDGEPKRPWTAMVVNRDQDLLLSNELTTEVPTADWLWKGIALALEHPAAGDPHRPAAIELRSPFDAALRPRLEAIGIECVGAGGLDLLDRVFADLSHHMAGGDLLPGLLDVPGMQAAQVGSFFATAAEFYRRAPWRDIAWDAAIKIACDKFQSGPWYALVMGQSGMVLGVALYEDLGILQATINSSGDEESFRRTSAISVLFGEAFEMPFSDLDAIDSHQWPIAAPEAYPHAQHINPGYAVRPLLPWELSLLEAVLRTLPDFIARREPEQTVSAQTGAGVIELRLAWMEV
jgi:tetratricopeptide (TPR) repeat protein